MDADETRLLTESLRALFAETSDPEGLPVALAELGWDEVTAEHPAAEALLFEEQGRARAVSGLLDGVVLRELGAPPTAAVAYRLGTGGDLFEPAAPVVDGTVRLDAVLRAVGPRASIVVPVAAPEGTRVLRVPSADVEVKEVAGLDPDGGWSRVTAALDPASAEPAPLWGQAVAAGRRALAAELVGLARAALELAVRHVTDRRQFGRPVGGFQAVRFRLAEVAVGIEAAAEAIRVAFADGGPLAAAVAKALAGAAVDRAVRQAAQVCGAMGLTWEFPLHEVMRRAYGLDMLFGDWETLTADLGRHVMAAGTLPQLDPFSVPAL
ncbi:acyl-CoA dehydrogenase family protein [Streptomyces gilvus]|uniref:acyl-CoA dehydrogenase family protein n=1 Tax=Streptomyces gilvus TaxID=2920937 RepID=UPI001F0EC5C2|nr:acyl-CoA dehydrogenase family protein [Streptomyces sp. CME 23]MCH5677574.1 hypothetical protein [Streptomyces sp. CME 23]